MRHMVHWAAVPLMGLTLAACGDDAVEPTADGETTITAPAEPSSETLAASLAGADDFGTLEAVVENAGLVAVLEGRGPYTVFAPSDAALTAGAGGADFSDATLKAEAAALVRAHMVPGSLTRADILAALDAAGADGVEMRTLSDGILTFSRDGDAIVVSTQDGTRGRLIGSEALVSNGVIQPVDTLLIAPPEPVPASES